MSGSSAFNALRPLCVVLMKEQTLDQVQAVSKVVESLDPESLQSLQQYVLFPLRILLKNQARLATGVCEAGVDCMHRVLKKTTISDWQMFSDIFTALCITISSKEACGQASQTSEELKLAVVKTLTAMIKSADPEVLLRLFSPPSLPMLGHCVSLLLSLAESERMRELQNAALQCLAHLVPDDDSQDSVPYQAASSCFASFLPGLSMTVSRVITADPKQGQSLTVSAIDCWSKHVAMVMDHRLLPSNKTQTEGEDKAKGNQPKEGEQSLLISKTKSWVTETATKLDILITKIVAMITSRSWKVRLALVRFADRLISRTKNSMPGSLNHHLELLVNLAQDDYDQVSSQSRIILRSLAQEPLTSESKMLSELLEDNMHRLVTSLPRLIRTADEETKLSTVTAMTGYIKLLGYKLNSMLNSAPHLKRLSIALLQALELEVRDLSVLETGSTLADSGNGNISAANVGLHNRHLRNFKHFSDSKIYEGIINLCQLLGKFGNVPLLIDNFLSYFHESSLYVKQATMIMNEIMAGTLLVVDDDDQLMSSIWKEEESESFGSELADSDELTSIVRMLLDEYLAPSCWDLPTSIQHTQDASSSPTASPRLPWQPSDQSHLTGLVMHSSPGDKLTISEMNHNTLLKCLLLDGISIFAQVLGPAFGQLLMHCLYPILERMADERTVISQHAHATLTTICQPCGYRSIAELLYANVDYLTDSVSARLRHFEWNPKAPLVLKVTLQHSASDILPLLQDTVEEVLRIMDDHHGNHAASLMSVLQALVVAIKKWFPVERSDGEGDEVESSKTDPVTDITKFCLDYIRAVDINDSDDNQELSANENDVDNDDNNTMRYQEDIDKPIELPLHVKNVKQVLEHCVHVLSSSDPRLRLLVLSTIQAAVRALETSQDVLLPLVHKLWPAFVQRFSDQETLVTCKAFETLLVLADTARDFIRRRTVKDVWPKLVKFLQTQAEISAKAGPSYHHTAYYKLQDSILNGMGHLCLQVDVREEELLSMVQACLPYLHKCQPIGLQEACLASFECFIEADPDALWFSLQDVHCPTLITPPHPSLTPCKLAGESASSREQWSNINKLLR